MEWEILCVLRWERPLRDVLDRLERHRLAQAIPGGAKLGERGAIDVLVRVEVVSVGLVRLVHGENMGMLDGGLCAGCGDELVPRGFIAGGLR